MINNNVVVISVEKDIPVEDKMNVTREAAALSKYHEPLKVDISGHVPSLVGE